MKLFSLPALGNGNGKIVVPAIVGSSLLGLITWIGGQYVTSNRSYIMEIDRRLQIIEEKAAQRGPTLDRIHVRLEGLEEHVERIGNEQAKRTSRIDRLEHDIDRLRR